MVNPLNPGTGIGQTRSGNSALATWPWKSLELKNGETRISQFPVLLQDSREQSSRGWQIRQRNVSRWLQWMERKKTKRGGPHKQREEGGPWGQTKTSPYLERAPNVTCLETGGNIPLNKELEVLVEGTPHLHVSWQEMMEQFPQSSEPKKTGWRIWSPGTLSFKYEDNKSVFLRTKQENTERYTHSSHQGTGEFLDDMELNERLTKNPKRRHCGEVMGDTMKST